MTKWQMLSVIFNSIQFCRNFIFCRFLLARHPFVLRLSFLLKIPRFIGVLGKMEYI